MWFIDSNVCTKRLIKFKVVDKIQIKFKDISRYLKYHSDITKACNKLECFSLVSFSNQVWCLGERPGVYPSVGHLSVSSLR